MNPEKSDKVDAESEAEELTNEERAKLADKIQKMVLLGGGALDDEAVRTAARKACRLIVQHKFLVRSKEAWDELGVTKTDVERAKQSMESRWAEASSGYNTGFGFENFMGIRAPAPSSRAFPSGPTRAVVSDSAIDYINVFTRVFRVLFTREYGDGGKELFKVMSTFDMGKEETKDIVTSSFGVAVKSAFFRVLQTVRAREEELSTEVSLLTHKLARRRQRAKKRVGKKIQRLRTVRKGVTS